MSPVAAPITSSPVDRDAYPTALRDAVDAYLADLRFSTEPMTVGLAQAMRYSLLAGGKRVRPVLVLATARVLGIDHREVLPLAAAIELIHTFSLIHDDLPAMDDDEMRRGRPTNHRVFGEGVAILAGDALFAEAFSLLLSRLKAPADRVLRAAVVIARALATDGVAGGQYVDLTGGAVDRDGVLRLHRLKTGALLQASVESVIELARATAKTGASLASYAADLGLMFQAIDDVLDVQGSSAQTGKDLGGDERNGRRTLVVDGETAAAVAVADGCLQRILHRLTSIDADTSELRAVAEYVRHRVA
ncbi:MAG: geranylgeranyl diphosphate synthase, type [Solirubrobacteraceae bacterium]